MKCFCFLLIAFFSINVWSYDFKPIEMSPPKVKPYEKRQVARVPDIRKYKALGYIGESETGFLAINPTQAGKAEVQAQVKKLIDEENKDRQAVVNEVVKYNKLNAKQKEILIKTIYEVFRDSSAKGTFYFEKGTWQKHF